ncbi:MAG: hypothetical protein OEY28_11970 [Nitrospira sp.]|nr:hypothetical protein [Nitrospira sp.]
MGHIERVKGEKGLALMGAMVVSLILVVLSVALLDMLWRESLSADSAEKAAVAQQLADAAGELVIGWFHSPQTAPEGISAALTKRLITHDGNATYFDTEGYSQFTGTADRPDVSLDASNQTDDRLLNDPDIGVFRMMHDFGVVRLIKIYAPTKPGALCTVDVAVETRHHVPFSQSITMELDAIELPPLRTGLQSKNNLRLIPEGHSVGGVHWGPVAVGKDMVIRRIEDIPALNLSAPITGRSYDESSVREDRWLQMWVGERVVVTEPLPDSTGDQILPLHVHDRQNPTPGIRLDQWSYDQLKRVAMKFGSYYAIDQEGLLYQDGMIAPSRGVTPANVFGSERAGDQLGLIFVDTLDQTAPHGDNLGTVHLNMPYFEGVAVIQGHVLFSPTSGGNSLNAQGPPTGDGGSRIAHETIPLTGLHLNGVLYAAGDITVGRGARVYGAVISEGNIVSDKAGATLEIWHDDDMSRGLYRGVPLVYRGPGTWSVRE